MPVPSNLPDGAKKIFMAAEKAAKEGTCKDSGDRMDECAARVAWSVVKKKYKKVGDKWVRKAAIVSDLEMAITRAAYDKATGEMRLRAVASDTEKDNYGDNATIELFQDFIDRIENGESVPEQFRSEFWDGGMPYVSISHYEDLNGKGVPGEIVSVYVDGNRLKSKIILHNTELGRAVFRAICDDLYGEEGQDREDKVRISIGFLDWMHKHKSDGYVFSRAAPEQICPRCEKGDFGVEFLRGQLVHEAFTRVPVNPRTPIEVERSMGDKITRKEDAASIIGDELAEELEEEQKTSVGRSDAFQTLSESEEEAEETVQAEGSETEVEEESEVDVQPEQKSEAEVERSGPTTLRDFVEAEEARKELVRMGDLWYALNEVVYNIFRSEEIEDKKTAIKAEIEEFRDMLTAKALVRESEAGKSADPMDQAWITFKSAVEQIGAQKVSGEDKLKAMQEPFNTLAEAIRESVEEPQEDIPTSGDGSVQQQLAQLSTSVALLTQIVQGQQGNGGDVPQRRSLTGSPFVPQQQKKKGDQFSQLARMSVGLDN